MATDIYAWASAYLVLTVILAGGLTWLVGMLYRWVCHLGTDMRSAIYMAYGSFTMISSIVIFFVFLVALSLGQPLLRSGLESVNYTVLVSTFIGSIALTYNFYGILRQAEPPSPHLPAI